MKLTEEKLKELFQEQTARGTMRQRECLTEEQFVKAATGELSEPDRLNVARHLMTCIDCTEEYRAVRSLEDWARDANIEPEVQHAPVVATPSFFDRLRAFVSTSWATAALAAVLLLMTSGFVWLLFTRQKQETEIARLNHQLSEQEQKLASTNDSLAETRRQLEESARRSSAAAATPTGASSSSEIDRLQRDLETLSQPQLEAPIVDLDPSPTRGGAADRVASVEVPTTASSVNFILNFSGEAQSNFEIELLTQSNKQIWQGRVRKGSASRSVNLTLPRRLISGTDYVIKLYGLRDGRREQIAEYAVRLTSR